MRLVCQIHSSQGKHAQKEPMRVVGNDSVSLCMLKHSRGNGKPKS